MYHGPTDQAVAGVSIHNILSYNGYRPKGGVVQAVVDNMAPKWKGGPTEGHEYIEQVESAPNKVEKFYVTGTKIIKKRGAPLVTEFSQDRPRREPGVYPSMVGSGGGDVPHGAYEFKLAKDLEEAIDYAKTAYDIEHTAKYFPEPEFYRYIPRGDEGIQEYFQNVADEEQLRRIAILREKGYSDEKIREFLEKQRERDMEKALADPSNVGNLLRAQIAQQLPTGPRQAFPITVSPGGIANPANAPAVALATGSLSAVQRSKLALKERLGGEALPASEKELRQKRLEALGELVGPKVSERGRKAFSTSRRGELPSDLTLTPREQESLKYYSPEERAGAIKIGLAKAREEGKTLGRPKLGAPKSL